MRGLFGPALPSLSCSWSWAARLSLLAAAIFAHGTAETVSNRLWWRWWHHAAVEIRRLMRRLLHLIDNVTRCLFCMLKKIISRAGWRTLMQ